MLEFRYIFGENGYKIAEATRKSIFCDELGMAEIRDGLDDRSYHFIGYERIEQIASARLTESDEKNHIVSYVAVRKDYRRQFVGDLIMRALADKVKRMGGKRISLTACADVKGFFEFEGYEQVGEAFFENGRECIKMEKDLTKQTESLCGCGR